MMIQARMRLPGFCMGRAMAAVGVRSSPPPYKKTYNSIKGDDKTEYSSNNCIDPNLDRIDRLKPDSENGNRVMVVVGSMLDSKGALHWTLSHTVQPQDTIILLHVIKPSKQGANSKRQRQKAFELLCSMKNMCQMRRPGVHVETVLVEGTAEGPTILEDAKQQRVSLLVLGQRRRAAIWRLPKMWGGRRNHNKVAEHCIQNATCMTIAVRRKSRKHGGYLINTQSHKDFWLLA